VTLRLTRRVRPAELAYGFVESLRLLEVAEVTGPGITTSFVSGIVWSKWRATLSGERASSSRRRERDSRWDR
jgi:hypothetical protein